jgi:OmpR family response regulator RpaB
MHRLLLIDDDEHLGPPLAAYLRRFDFELQAATRPSDGLALLARGGFDAVILDVMLPEMDGFEVCRRIRQQAGAGGAIPVLMLTARGELSDRVVGLELGADDYLPKPFEPRELAARLQTILRRARPPASAPVSAVAAGGRSLGVPATPALEARWLRFDGLQIDIDRREVQREGEAVELTSTEFELLTLLAREPQRVFTRDEILNRLRGREADLYTRAVDLLVSRLRRKLAPLDAIKTLRNAGYTLALARCCG